MIVQRLLDRGHLAFAWESRGSWPHDFGARELPELGVEHPDGIDVAAREQRLHCTPKAHARLQVGKVPRIEPDLDDARLVDAGHAGIFEMLIVDLPLAGLLDDLILLAGEQRPEHVCLRLLER